MHLSTTAETLKTQRNANFPQIPEGRKDPLHVLKRSQPNESTVSFVTNDSSPLYQVTCVGDHLLANQFYPEGECVPHLYMTGTGFASKSQVPRDVRLPQNYEEELNSLTVCISKRCLFKFLRKILMGHKIDKSPNYWSKVYIHMYIY